MSQSPPVWLLAPTAFLAALAIAVAVRSVGDLIQPVKVGEFAEKQRQIFQWLWVAGMAPLIWLVLFVVSRIGAPIGSDGIVSLLVSTAAAAGIALAARSFIRLALGANAPRVTYTDDMYPDVTDHHGRRDFMPGDKIALWVGCLLCVSAFALWRAADRGFWC